MRISIDPVWPWRLALLIATLAGARWTPLAAQTFPTDDPVIKRIWAIGVDSSQVEHLSSVLFDSIGPRLTGSPDLKRGNDWLVKTYASWGIDAKNEQYGTWRGWRRGYSHIDLVEPRIRSLEGTMLGYSPGTGKRDLTAQTVILPRFADSGEFVKWLPNAKGKFVLVAGLQPTCRPTDDWDQNATPESKLRMDTLRAAVQREWRNPDVRGTGYSLAIGTGELGIRLEQAGVAAIITSRPKNGWGTIEIFETYDTRAPAIALSCEDYGLVYRLTEHDQHPTLRLNLDGELLGERPVFNTVATIKGVEKPDEYVMLSAHFDSWDGSSGATDNGTGTVTMLEAMRILKTVYPHPKRTILVGHWASEEQGLNGSTAFTEDHPEVMKGLQALFNQDNGTGRVQSLSSSGLTDIGHHLKSWYSKLPPFFTDSMSSNVVSWSFNDVPTGNPGGTDGAVFACFGTPSFGMGAVSWNYNSYTWHTNRDTYDKIVFDDLKHNATLAAMLVYLASEDPEFIKRDRSPGTWPENWPANCGKVPRTTKPRL